MRPTSADQGSVRDLQMGRRIDGAEGERKVMGRAEPVLRTFFEAFRDDPGECRRDTWEVRWNRLRLIAAAVAALVEPRKGRCPVNIS